MILTVLHWSTEQDDHNTSANRASSWIFPMFTSWNEHPLIVCKTAATGHVHRPPALLYCSTPLSFGTNFIEWLKIQNLDIPSSGPSLRNSWPSPSPQLPHRTLYAVSVSITLVTLSWWMVSVKAGQGEECAYLDLLVNSGFAHWEQT